MEAMKHHVSSQNAKKTNLLATINAAFPRNGFVTR